MATPTAPIALITGGNRGIGRSIVETLATRGTDVILTYRSHADEAQQVVDAVKAQGARAVALPLDLAEPDTFGGFAEAVGEALQAQWGRTTFDILINNAGFSLDSSLGSTGADVLDQLFTVHVKSVYLLTQALATADGAPPLLADGGRIVNFSTCLTRIVSPPYAVYAAMKGAVEVLTRYWAGELGPRGISVNAIAPGPVATDFAGGLMRDNAQARTAMGSMTALGRIAEPDDIGAAVAALVDQAPGGSPRSGSRPAWASNSEDGTRPPFGGTSAAVHSDSAGRRPHQPVPSSAAFSSIAAQVV